MNMSKFMRMLVFFDLPVQTKAQRRAATQFRNFLLKDGYYMIQYSVYGRVCHGYDDVEKHRGRINLFVPDNGSIRLLTITEKQYGSMELFIGKLKNEEATQTYEQLSIF